jgi:hypothetical protein
MIPGANILAMASTVINTFTVNYYKNTSRVKGNNGLLVPVYALPIQLKGSLQPVARNLYEQFGLDLSKFYYTFYCQKDILDLSRDISGDKLEFLGNTYQCESSTDWFPFDGWVGILCVKQQPG